MYWKELVPLRVKNKFESRPQNEALFLLGFLLKLPATNPVTLIWFVHPQESKMSKNPSKALSLHDNRPG